MKKIGILTYSYGCNYGGTLQCLGLYKYLKENNYGEIIVLDYYPKNTYNFLHKYLLGSIITKNINDFFNFYKIIKKLQIKIKYVNKTLKNFDFFRKQNLKMSIPENDLNKLINNEELSHIIVGSDQVWGSSSAYFLNNVDNKNLKKISYAACSGREEIQIKNKNEIKEGLLKFANISVRNQHTYNFVKNITNISSEIVCDPSLLYDYKEFLQPNIKKEKYILTYILGKDIKEGNSEVIKKIKEIYGDMKVIAIGIPFAISGGLRFYKWADEILYDAKPEEWLNLINNAEFIFTDSYHGILFSMKFHKQFLGYYTEMSRSPRLVDLAKRYQVDKYIVNTLEEAIEKKSLEKIDYKNVDILIEKHRKYSRDFLKRVLED